MSARTFNEGEKVMLKGMFLKNEEIFLSEPERQQEIYLLSESPEMLDRDIIDTIQFCEGPSTQYFKFYYILLAGACNSKLCSFIT